MVILIKANLRCNFANEDGVGCKYCYQQPIRPEDEVIDYEAVEATIRRLHAKGLEKRGKSSRKDGKPRGPTIGLHGGEPTMLPKSAIERFLKLSHELNGNSSIQTNGYLIDDDMIEMFKKYNTGVGISIDGPWPLNELRGFGDVQQRKKQTAKILKTIDKLTKTKLPEKYWSKDKDGNSKESFIRVSVIAVIHKKNALGDRLETLKQWVKTLHEKRIYGRLNPCCSNNPNIDLTPEEAAETYSDLFDFLVENGIDSFSPFKDINNSIRGESEVVCVYKECDPYCTPSAQTVMKDGSVGVCLRLHQDGKQYPRHEPMKCTRGDVLRQSDCKDCDWWENCHGGCIGLAVDFDWRNRDRHCLMYKTLFEKTKNMLKFMRIRPKQKKSPPRGGPPPSGGGGGGGDHWDGFTHVDGDWKHIDSDVQ